MNDTIPFVGEKDLEESVLYEPVKSLAPLIFPSIIKTTEDENLEA
jgi:membrane protein required for colicin V production